MLKHFKKFIALAAVFTLIGATTVFAAPNGSSFFSAPAPLTDKPITSPHEVDQFMGYKFIPFVDITITALGRGAEGMSQEHEVRLWDMTGRGDPGPEWNTGDDLLARGGDAGCVLMAQVKVTPNSQQDSGFYYEPLGNPVVLKAGVLYCIATYETEDGDIYTDPPTTEAVIGDLIRNDIAYICEDAHCNDPIDSSKKLTAPANWWKNDWNWAGADSARQGNNVGIRTNANFWFVVGEIEAEADNSGGSGSDAGSGGKDTPVTGDNSAGAVALAGLFIAAAVGAWALSVKKKRVNN